MGSWNGTCGLTNLPIGYDDKVKVLFITQNNLGSSDHVSAGYCYSDQYWVPRALPFTAKYDDYGRFEDVVEDWNTKFILENVFKGVIPMEQGENPYHEPAVDPSKLTDLHEIACLMQDDRIRVKYKLNIAREKGELLVGFMMFHEDIYNEMSNVMYGDWEPTKYLTDILVNDAEEFYAAYKVAVGNMNELDQKLIEAGISPISLRRIQVPWQNVYYPLADDSRRLFNGFVDFDPKHYAKLLNQYAVEGRDFHDEDVTDFFTQFGAFMCFSSNFSQLRKTFQPQAGAGSQSSNYTAFSALTELTEKQIKAAKSKYDDDEDYQDCIAEEAEGRI